MLSPHCRGFSADVPIPVEHYTHDLNRFLTVAPRSRPISAVTEPAERVAHVGSRGDVVALEHDAGLVARDLHRDRFRDAAPRQVAGDRPPEGVETPTGAVRVPASRPPGTVEVADVVTRPGAAHLREPPGADHVVVRDEALADLPLILDYVRQLRHRRIGQVPPLAVLRSVQP